MASEDALDCSIQQCPQSLMIRHQILQSFWQTCGSLSEFQDGHLQCDKYFFYYVEQCRLALHDSGRHILPRTHRDIIEIAAYLHNSAWRSELREKLRPKLDLQHSENGNEILDNTIDLMVRLVFMINVGSFQYGVSGYSQLSWKDSTLSDFVRQRFSPPQVLKGTSIKLEKIFNARNLQRIAGIQIIWTKNLADHLSIRDDDTRVAIFHHASFLQYQRESTYFPPGFINETLTTLALLFPQYDKASTAWYRKLATRLSLDTEATRCGHLKASDRQIENFAFWHDRLVILKQVFDEAEPSTISEWWHDRRKGVQWYTFWVAATVLSLTIFFGAVQCIEGGLQVYKAYHPS